MTVRIPRTARLALSGAAIVLLAGAACFDEGPTTEDNVELQILNYGGTLGSVLVTTPRNGTYDIPLRQSSDNPDTWLTRMAELRAEDEIRFVLRQSGNEIASLTCTVHPRAIVLTYARAHVDGINEDTGAFERLVCQCGFREYGETRNQEQCSFE
jgi:hypothetical protein